MNTIQLKDLIRSTIAEEITNSADSSDLLKEVPTVQTKLPRSRARSLASKLKERIVKENGKWVKRNPSTLP